ncbi:hypothetical protein AAHH21_11185 [Stenotrophomonas sp. BSUC-16]|jgi:hypothetical protein|uniref:Uncharacterized protein n=1 Tax=Stenotrophomonas maltophilia TaxID=40324 RepID=A0A246IFB7_STEMA|nr:MULTISPECIES: hypothetical protein [Stenotrophomonas maltophilia group]MCZ7842901.1 hypothetical protein [Stenotrophomonas maltophilia]MDJ1625521.1 hypothetical protein [Stenotrophomonas sepilia]OWQ78826.1 hypothetical protein CEE63_00680 [Stenotrophomonas maltophilia]PZT31441.1 hypothetical protein A7X97_19690 [Stenotrophomonas sepilia]
MNDVEHDMPEPVQIDFPPLLNWDEVMRDECEDPLGFARRTTYALLTLPEAGLLAGFSGGNQKGLEEARRTVALFQAHLRRQMWFAEAAEKRLGRVAEALAAAG